MRTEIYGQYVAWGDDLTFCRGYALFELQYKRDLHKDNHKRNTPYDRENNYFNVIEDASEGIQRIKAAWGGK